MSSDQIDDLALYRARRSRDRRASEPGTAGKSPQSTEQRDAIARARESWALSQLGREAHARRGPDAGAPSDAVVEGPDALVEDD